jgi:hypothetical protein
MTGPRCSANTQATTPTVYSSPTGCKGSADGTSDSPGKRGNSFPLAQAIAVSPCCDRIQWPSRRAPTTLWQGDVEQDTGQAGCPAIIHRR